MYVRKPKYEAVCKLDGCDNVFLTNGKVKFCSREHAYKFHNLLQEEHLRRDGRARIKCLVCGKTYIKVGNHVVNTHKYESAREYKREFGLNLKNGSDTTPEDYKEVMREHVYENGTIENLESGVKYWFTSQQASQLRNAYWDYMRKEHPEKMNKHVKKRFENE